MSWLYGCFFLTFSLTWTSLLHILGDPSFICLFGLLVPSIVCTHKPWSIICSFQFLQICSQILDLGGTQTLQQSVNQGTPSITRQPIKVYNNQVNIIISALALGLWTYHSASWTNTIYSYFLTGQNNLQNTSNHHPPSVGGKIKWW